MRARSSADSFFPGPERFAVAIDHAHFYRGDAAWMGLFDLNGDYYKTAYAFKAMGRMLDTPLRKAADGTDTFGFAALAGRSEDDKTVQVFISNYAIPAGYKPKDMHMPVELQDPAATSQWDERKYKYLPNRTGIVYRDNAGYCLTIKHLPWGKDAFTINATASARARGWNWWKKRRVTETH